MADLEWAAGDDLSLADRGAAPFLFYADWAHRSDPSSAPAAVEARPYRRYFPLGAPDRD